jgi:DNA polymerase III epsilon subunit family exonuclease
MFICLDIETTGLNADEDHIIEVAIVSFDHEKILSEWSSLVKPPVAIPEFVERLTGINDEMVADAPRIADLADEIRKQVGDAPIMGHFISFDIGFLTASGIDFPAETNQALDTCQLSQVFMPNEASYSLEVLARDLGISQPDAHRALDDVKANIDLFWKISAHIRSLPENKKSATREILTKSTWPWSNHLVQILDQAQKTEDQLLPEKKTEPTNPNTKQESHADLTKLVQNTNLATPFLLEEPGHTYQDLLDYANNLDGKSLLTVPSINQLPSHEDLGIVKHPNEYIDEDRLATMLNSEELNTPQSMLGIKAKLWLFDTKTGDRTEIKTPQDERAVWHQICCQSSDTPNSFYARASELALSKKVIAQSHMDFLKERSKKSPSLNIPENLVVGQAEELIKEVEYSWHLTFSELKLSTEIGHLQLEAISSKISILFGLLGLLMEKYVPATEKWPSLDIESLHRSTQEWAKIQDSADSVQELLLEANSKLKPSPTLDEFIRYFEFLNKVLKNPGEVLWITKNQNGELILHYFPKDPSQIFSKRIWNNKSKLHMFCHHGDISDDFSFLKSELGLPEKIATPTNAFATAATANTWPLPILQLHSKVSNPNDQKSFKESAHELDLQLMQPEIGTDPAGNIFIMVTSANAAESFFYALQKLTEKTGRKLFIQNMSGGMGKIAALSKETDGQNIFVGKEGLLYFLLNSGVQLDFLAIHRLPFAHPNNPTQKTRANKYQNAYKEFSLPQAALRFRTILNHFLGNTWQDKKILILDPRIKNYEGVF